MLIGIKYCGGCNSKFDRVKFVEAATNKYDNHKYEYAVKEKKYDLLLLICGCDSRCVDVGEYMYDKIVTISSENQFEALDEVLN